MFIKFRSYRDSTNNILLTVAVGNSEVKYTVLWFSTRPWRLYAERTTLSDQWAAVVSGRTYAN